MERAASHSIEGVYVMTGTDEGLDSLCAAEMLHIPRISNTGIG